MNKRFYSSATVILSSLALFLALAIRSSYAQDVQESSLSPRAVEAINLLESNDPYMRQLGFIRLEALREPASSSIAMKYADSRDPDLRAYSLRLLAAVQGPAAVPLLLEKLNKDKHF